MTGRNRRWALLAPVVAWLWLLLGAGPAGAQSQEELQSLRTAIEASRSRLEIYERDQRGLLDALEAIDRLTGLLRRDVRDRRAEIAAAEAERERIEAKREVLEGRLDTSRAALRARALALYKTGEAGPVQVLFAAASLREIFERARALQLLLSHDQRLVARYRDQRDALAELESQAAAAAERHSVALAQLETRTREIAAERGTKRRVLDQTREDRARERAALGELEAAARALQETLHHLDRGGSPKPIPGADFAKRQGRLPRPVEAPLASGFGRSVDDEFHTQLFHKGIAFGAELGAPVRAVAPGRVRFAGWFRGYGRMVILDHGESFFTVSGHLAHIEVAVGQELADGDRIGTVGESGSLVGPRLYFELRHGDAALNPVEWFEQR